MKFKKFSLFIGTALFAAMLLAGCKPADKTPTFDVTKIEVKQYMDGVLFTWPDVADEYVANEETVTENKYFIYSNSSSEKEVELNLKVPGYKNVTLKEKSISFDAIKLVLVNNKLNFENGNFYKPENVTYYTWDNYTDRDNHENEISKTSDGKNIDRNGNIKIGEYEWFYGSVLYSFGENDVWYNIKYGNYPERIYKTCDPLTINSIDVGANKVTLNFDAYDQDKIYSSEQSNARFFVKYTNLSTNETKTKYIDYSSTITSMEVDGLDANTEYEFMLTITLYTYNGAKNDFGEPAKAKTLTPISAPTIVSVTEESIENSPYTYLVVEYETTETDPKIKYGLEYKFSSSAWATADVDSENNVFKVKINGGNFTYARVYAYNEDFEAERVYSEEKYKSCAKVVEPASFFDVTSISSTSTSGNTINWSVDSFDTSAPAMSTKIYAIKMSSYDNILFASKRTTTEINGKYMADASANFITPDNKTSLGYILPVTGLMSSFSITKDDIDRGKNRIKPEYIFNGKIYIKVTLMSSSVLYTNIGFSWIN